VFKTQVFFKSLGRTVQGVVKERCPLSGNLVTGLVATHAKPNRVFIAVLEHPDHLQHAHTPMKDVMAPTCLGISFECK